MYCVRDTTSWLGHPPVSHKEAIRAPFLDSAVLERSELVITKESRTDPYVCYLINKEVMCRKRITHVRRWKKPTPS